MRLIDADALKSKIREQPWKQETKVSLILEWIYTLIDEASTVQNEALQRENEQLQAQAARVRETLRKASAGDKATWFECTRCGSIRDTLTTITKIIRGAEDGKGGRHNEQSNT